MLAEQHALLGTQARQLAAALDPLLIPTPDVQRLLWSPGIERLVAFTILLEVDKISRFPSARDFVSYCRLVPGAGNSGGKIRHKRTKDGNRYLKIAFSHAAIRAIQYFPEIRAFHRALARRKPPIVARAIVAKELARIVYYVITKQEALNGTFKGKPLRRMKAPKRPWLANPPVQLEPPPQEACSSAAFDWGAKRRAVDRPLGPAHGLRTRNGVWPPPRRDRIEAEARVATGTCTLGIADLGDGPPVASSRSPPCAEAL